MPLNKPKSSWSLWGVQLGWGPSSSLAATAPGRWSRGAAGPCALPNAPAVPAGSPSLCRASPTCRSEVRLCPTCGKGEHKMVAQTQGWLLGALWQDKPPWLSLPNSEGSGFFSLNFREFQGTRTPGWSQGRGGGCHGHIPKAECVPKASDVPNTDHIIMSSMTTTSLRPTVFLSDNCVPKDNPVPKLNHIPKPPMSPWSTAFPRPEMSPTVPAAQLCPQDASDPTASHIPKAHPVPEAGCVPWAAVSRGSGVSSPICFLWASPLECGWKGHTLGRVSLPCPSPVPQRPAWTPNLCQKPT